MSARRPLRPTLSRNHIGDVISCGLPPHVLQVGAPQKKARSKAPKHWESHLQTAMVRYFAAAVPNSVIGLHLTEQAVALGALDGLPETAEAILFAVPNGDARDPFVMARLKEEGLCPGMLDFVVLARGGKCLIFEVKTDSCAIRGISKGYPDRRQKLVIALLRQLGFPTTVIRSLPEFADALAANGLTLRHRPLLA